MREENSLVLLKTLSRSSNFVSVPPHAILCNTVIGNMLKLVLPFLVKRYGDSSDRWLRN